MNFTKINEIRLLFGRSSLVITVTSLVLIVVALSILANSDGSFIYSFLVGLCFIFVAWGMLALLYGMSEREYKLSKKPDEGSLAASYDAVQKIATSIEVLLFVTTIILYFSIPIFVFYLVLR